MSNINEKNQGPRWYVAHTYTGYENKVKDSIEKMVENRGLGHLIYDIKVPSVREQVLDENGKPVLDKNGEEKIVETKLFPSYVFVKMTMNDESWHVVRNITGVTGFVGPGSEPTPLTDAEIEMFNVEVISDDFKFALGDKVKDNIEKMVENRGLGHLIYDVKVPAVKENVLDENGKPVLDKNGVEKIVETKIFPSYVFVKMTMNDESWHVVRNITGVTGFVGPGSEPTPLTDEEVEMFQVEVNSEEFKFKIGDRVEVVSGIFAGYSGVLQEISEDKKSLTILASTERRDIPIMVETKDVRIAE